MTARIPLDIAATVRVGSDKEGHPVLQLADGMEIDFQTDRRSPNAVTKLEAVDAAGNIVFSITTNDLKTLEDWKAKVVAPLAARSYLDSLPDRNRCLIQSGSEANDPMASCLPVQALTALAKASSHPSHY